MNTKLIITEGLPGSGKSTAAAMIASILERQGKKVVCFGELEGGAMTVIDTLKELVTEEGSIFMPALRLSPELLKTIIYGSQEVIK